MPTSSEIILASDCRRCRVYFKKTGPVCAHCHLEDVIVSYRLKLIAFKSKRKIIVSLAAPAESSANASDEKTRIYGKAGQKKDRDKGVGQLLGDGSDAAGEDSFKAQEFNSEQVPGAFSMIVKHLRAYAVRHALPSRTGGEDLSVLRDAAVAECRRCECLWRELLAMTGLWQRYMALLKVHDEVEQGRRRIGLSYNDERDGSDVMDENNLHPFELSVRYQEDFELAVGKSVALSECVGQLSFYKNQEAEARQRVSVLRKQQLKRREQLATQSRLIPGGLVALPLGVEAEKEEKGKEKETGKNSLSDANLERPIEVGVEDKDEDNDKDEDGDEDEDGLEPTCIVCQENLFSSSECSLSSRPVGPSGADTDAAAGTLTAVQETVVCLPCAHSFHMSCVKRWLQVHRACPVCKRSATLNACMAVETPTRSRPSADQRPMARTRVVLEVGKSDGQLEGSLEAEAEAEAEVEVEVKGQWGSKIDALLADLVRLLAKGGDSVEGEKAIVFSQWSEMLEIVGEALRANNILFSMCMSRAKDFSDCGSLETFKSDMDTRVLLMPLHLGAEGLDLIQASHVFLLEPLLNPALESQAVNRIHRIGQLRTTHVHKFAVTGTVEALIIKAQELKILAPFSHSNPATPSGRGYQKGARGKQQGGKGKSDQDLLTLENIRYLLGVSQNSDSDL
jgi:Ring finger domain/Helicase conserved C-terminal domain